MVHPLPLSIKFSVQSSVLIVGAMLKHASLAREGGL
jgi:hypothetical protein